MIPVVAILRRIIVVGAVGLLFSPPTTTSHQIGLRGPSRFGPVLHARSWRARRLGAASVARCLYSPPLNGRSVEPRSLPPSDAGRTRHVPRAIGSLPRACCAVPKSVCHTCGTSVDEWADTYRRFDARRGCPRRVCQSRGTPRSDNKTLPTSSCSHASRSSRLPNSLLRQASVVQC